MVYVKTIYNWRSGRACEYKYCYTHRKDPVPYAGWGNNKASGRGCYRRIRTTQEQRANFDLEVRHLIRLKRRKMKSAWDDIPYGDWKHNCWKKCTRKKRQWM